MYERYKVMFGCDCCISDKIMHSSLLSYWYHHYKKPKYQSENSQNRRSGEMYDRLIDAYKKYVTTHGHNIYKTESDMDMLKMCAYKSYHHVLTHWKFLLHCCANLPHIYLTGQEPDIHHSNAYPTLRFHVYHLISHCKVHGRLPLYEKNHFCLCLSDPASVPPEKLYTRKYLVIMETYIADFHASFYIPVILMVGVVLEGICAYACLISSPASLHTCL